MNKIIINNSDKLTATVNSVNVTAGVSGNNNSTIIVLNEDDIENENYSNKLRGYRIDVLIVPKQYKNKLRFTTNGHIIFAAFTEKTLVTYY